MSKPATKWYCPKCGLRIRCCWQKHLSACDGNGPRRITRPSKGRGQAWAKGTRHSEERKRQISALLKGKATVLTPEKETERRKKLSRIAKENSAGNYGGYKPGSGRGKHGWFKGIWCDSSWELAWVIHSLDHGVGFVRNTTKFPYEWNGQTRFYVPDFHLENGEYVEVKGWMTDQNRAKIAAFPHRLTVLMKNEMTPIIEYVVSKYGRNFVRLYGGV